MAALHDWLVFFRIHTACLTQGALLVGYLLAGGELGTPRALVWIAYGTLFHGVGFALNNLADLPYDRKDPSKANHPLVVGRINYNRACMITFFLYLLLVVWGAWIVRSNIDALILLGICIISGLVYNSVSKTALWAPVPISLCFGPLPAVSYFATGGELNWLITLVTAYFIGQIFWQIAYEGYLKDLEFDEVNLLRKLGARVEGRVILNTTTTLFGYLTKTLPLFLIIPILEACSPSTLSVTLTGVFLLITMGTTTNLTMGVQQDRTKTVLMCALTEIFTFYALLAALSGTIGITTTTTLMVYFITWYILWNKFYWGTLIAPAV